jgi:hypothetical protein
LISNRLISNSPISLIERDSLQTTTVSHIHILHISIYLNIILYII